MMVVTLEEMKQYLRVDYEDDDQLITDFIASAEPVSYTHLDVYKRQGEDTGVPEENHLSSYQQLLPGAIGGCGEQAWL